MSVKKLTAELYAKLGERGYKCSIVSVERLDDLKQEIESRKSQGLLDQRLYREYFTSFSYHPPESLTGARSLIVVAAPQPQIQVVFNWNGKPQPLIIPPTYLHYSDGMVRDLLADVLESKGYEIASVLLPVKLLSARSGLSFYGKNNICYVPGMGSFHRLMAFYSDLSCLEDIWHESVMLEDCENCLACLNACPTGAITSDRFLIKAERCLSFLNENSGDFPEWLNPSWHNCLVGCLHCQSVCPKNRDFVDWIEPGAEFSEEETGLLLNGAPLEKLPAVTVKKLEHLDMIGYHDVLPRNLRVLLK
ncbi:MAG: 4Fe-4S dicluster domain-containing protein [candidate division Zixibacteria bacterium]|nr:4Fe-4S dicluster domain-containing protein [candidate division Zixibacteria bacterium]